MLLDWILALMRPTYVQAAQQREQLQQQQLRQQHPPLSAGSGVKEEQQPWTAAMPVASGIAPAGSQMAVEQHRLRQQTVSQSGSGGSSGFSLPRVDGLPLPSSMLGGARAPAHQQPSLLHEYGLLPAQWQAGNMAPPPPPGGYAPAPNPQLLQSPRGAGAAPLLAYGVCGGMQQGAMPLPPQVRRWPVSSGLPATTGMAGGGGGMAGMPSLGLGDGFSLSHDFSLGDPLAPGRSGVMPLDFTMTQVRAVRIVWCQRCEEHTSETCWQPNFPSSSLVSGCGCMLVQGPWLGAPFLVSATSLPPPCCCLQASLELLSLGDFMSAGQQPAPQPPSR